MAKSVLDIVINMAKQGNADTQVVSGLVSIKSGMTQAMGVAAGLTAAAYAVNQAYQATVGVFVDYADQVRDVTRETGMSAEEASKLIQAGDDLFISYDNLKKGLYEMSKRGTEPTIESLKKMADEYLALNPGVERAEYLTKNFGKSGQEMGKLLEQGSEGIQKYTDAVSANMTLTQKQLDEAKQLKVTQDQLNDLWEGLAITIGSKATPAIAAWTKFLGDNIQMLLDGNLATLKYLVPFAGLIDLTRDYGTTFNQLQAEAQNTTNALDANSEAVKNNGAAVEAVMPNYQALFDLTMNMQNANDAHTQKVNELKGSMDELNTAYINGKIDTEEYMAKKEDLLGQMDKEAKAWEEQSKKIVFSMLQQKLSADGLTDAEFNMLMTVGEGMGLIDSKIATQAKSLNDNIGKLDNAKPKEFYDIMTKVFGLPANKAMQMTLEHFTPEELIPFREEMDKIQAYPDEKHINIITTYTTEGTPPDLPDPTSGESGINGQASGMTGGSRRPIQQGGTFGATAGGRGGGTVIHIHNMTVHTHENMTREQFVAMLNGDRE